MLVLALIPINHMALWASVYVLYIEWVGKGKPFSTIIDSSSSVSVSLAE